MDFEIFMFILCILSIVSLKKSMLNIYSPQFCDNNFET